MALHPAPTKNAVVETSRLVGTIWRDWFVAIRDLVNLAASRVAKVELIDQGAGSATTVLTVPTSGLYRVSWVARITRAATSSSSLTVTTGWTETVALTQAGTAITGNTTTSYGTGSALVRADAGTAITVTTAYASVGATTMQFSLRAVVELVP